MVRGRVAWSIAISLALSIAILSLAELPAIHLAGSAFAFMVTPVGASNSQPDGYDDYLEPCVGCTPSEEDYENLTTFELLAKYPELSGDPISNETTNSQTQAFNLTSEGITSELSVEDSGT